MKQCAVNAATAAKYHLSLSQIGLFSVTRAGKNGSHDTKRKQIIHSLTAKMF